MFKNESRAIVIKVDTSVSDDLLTPKINLCQIYDKYNKNAILIYMKLLFITHLKYMHLWNAHMHFLL